MGGQFGRRPRSTAYHKRRIINDKLLDYNIIIIVIVTSVNVSVVVVVTFISYTESGFLTLCGGSLRTAVKVHRLQMLCVVLAPGGNIFALLTR